MPTYELICIMKQMDNSALKILLSRTATYILESGANLRKMENLGVKNTPKKLSVKNSEPLNMAQYYLFEYDAGVHMNYEINDKFKRDVEIIKAKYFLTSLTPVAPIVTQKELECTIYKDQLPPPYRPNVLKLMEVSNKLKKRKEAKKINYNIEEGFSPF